MLHIIVSSSFRGRQHNDYDWNKCGTNETAYVFYSLVVGQVGNSCSDTISEYVEPLKIFFKKTLKRNFFVSNIYKEEKKGSTFNRCETLTTTHCGLFPVYVDNLQKAQQSSFN